MTTSAAPKPALARPLFGALVTALLSLFLAALDQTVVSTALPVIATDLRGFNQYTWVIAAYLIPLAVSMPISAKLSAEFGQRAVFAGCLTLFALGSIISASAYTMGILIAGRSIQGLGAGGLIAGAFGLIATTFMPRERLKWSALAGSVFSLASVLGPVIGGYITDHWSWPWIFLVNIPACLLLYILAGLLPHGGTAHHSPLDILGALLAVVTTVPLVLALLQLGQNGNGFTLPTIALFVITVVGAVLFGWAEKRAKSPILRLSLFSYPSFSLICLIIILTSGVFFGAVLYIPLFLQVAAGRSAQNSGILLLPLVLGVFVGNFAAGRIAHHTGRYFRIGLLSLMAMVYALQQLSGINQSTSSTSLTADMLVLGLGLGPGMTLFQTISLNLVPATFTSEGVGATGFFRTVGGALGAAVLGSVFYHSLNGGLAKIPAGGITNQYLAGQLHDPDVIVTGQASGDLLEHITPQALYDMQPAIVQYLGLARGAIADAVGGMFGAALVLGVISLLLFFGVEERTLRSAHDTPAPPCGPPEPPPLAPLVTPPESPAEPEPPPDPELPLEPVAAQSPPELAPDPAASS